MITNASKFQADFSRAAIFGTFRQGRGKVVSEWRAHTWVLDHRRGSCPNTQLSRGDLHGQEDSEEGEEARSEEDGRAQVGAQGSRSRAARPGTTEVEAARSAGPRRGSAVL